MYDKRKNDLTWKICIALMSGSFVLCSPATGLAEESPDAAAKEAAAEQKTAAASITEEPKVPVTDVEVTAQKDKKLQIGQADDAEGVNDYVITHSSTGSKSDMESQDLPQTITSVGQKVMKDQHVNTFEQALSNIAGVSPISTLDYWHNSGRYSIRGFGSGFEAPFYVNGMSDIDSTLSRWAGNLDRVEVLKGPSAVLYGAGSPGGTINFITKKPLRHESYTFGMDFGSWGSKAQDLDISLPLTKDKRWLSRLIMQKSDDRAFQGGIKLQRFDGSLVIQGQPKPDIMYTLEMGYHHHHGVNPSDITLPAKGTLYPPYGLIPYDAAYDSPDVAETYIGRTFQARMDYKVNKTWNIHTALSYSNRSTHANTEFVYNNSLNVNKKIFEEVGWTEKMGETSTRAWEITANGKFQKLGLKHDMTIGYTWAHTTWTVPWCNYNRGTLGTVSIYTPQFPSVWCSGSWTNDVVDNVYRFGTYLSDVIEINPRLKIAAGISITKNKDSSQETDQVIGRSYRGGATYELSKCLTAFAGYSTYYMPLSPITNTAKEKFVFTPETGDQWEGGLKFDLSDKASATLSQYLINRRNRVYTLPPGENPRRYAQIGQQTSRGIELDFSYNFRPGWDLLLAYSHCNAYISQDSRYAAGSRIPDIPENTFRLWTTYELQKGRYKGLGFGAGITHVGKKALMYDPSYGNLEGHTTFDALIYYKHDNCRYSLNIYNLTNQRYWQNGGSNYVQAGTPFSFVFRIEKTF